MSKAGFTTAFSIDRTPEEVFAAVANVRGWWSGEVDGPTEKVGDEFTYRYEDVHRSTQRVIEATPGERVVWRVLDARLSFAEDKDEWIGTEIRFEIAKDGDHTRLTFTHAGLAPACACFDACSSAWGYYIGKSLHDLIKSGRGAPSTKEAAASHAQLGG